MELEYTFGQWLKKQTGRQGPVGDIAMDYVARNGEGVSCCSRFQRYDTILRHIRSKHSPCPTALEALREAYEEYRSVVRFR